MSVSFLNHSKERYRPVLKKTIWPVRKNQKASQEELIEKQALESG
jgi:hypothetical protein